MQSLTARSPEQQEHLRELREWHHTVHLQFCRRIFERQVANGCHCHLEQTKDALSWRTTALMKLPGYRAEFDACAYGAQCQDVDGIWKPCSSSCGANVMVLINTALRKDLRLGLDFEPGTWRTTSLDLLV